MRPEPRIIKVPGSGTEAISTTGSAIVKLSIVNPKPESYKNPPIKIPIMRPKPPRLVNCPIILLRFSEGYKSLIKADQLILLIDQNASTQAKPIMMAQPAKIKLLNIYK